MSFLYKSLILAALGLFVLTQDSFCNLNFTFLSEAATADVYSGAANPDNFFESPRLQLKNLLFVDSVNHILGGDLKLGIRALSDYGYVQNKSIKKNQYDLMINEAYYSRYFESFFLVSAGRKKVKWGVGYAASPTDLISAPVNPDDPQDKFYSVQGSDFLQGSFFYKEIQTDFYLLPLTEHNRNWIRSDAAAMRVYYYHQPVDFSLLGRVEGDRRISIGTNSSLALWQDLELHAEYLWQSENENFYPSAPGSFAQKTGDVSRVLAGGQWSPAVNWNAVLEYFYFSDGYSSSEWDRYQNVLSNLNAALKQDLTKESAQNSLRSLSDFSAELIKRQNYLFARVKKEQLLKDTDIEWITLFSLDDGSSLHRFSLIWHFSSSAELYCRDLFTLGGGQSEFAQSRQKNLTQVGLEYRF